MTKIEVESATGQIFCCAVVCMVFLKINPNDSLGQCDVGWVFLCVYQFDYATHYSVYIPVFPYMIEIMQYFDNKGTMRVVMMRNVVSKCSICSPVSFCCVVERHRGLIAYTPGLGVVRSLRLGSLNTPRVKIFSI